MTFVPTIPFPVAQWQESAVVAQPLVPLYVAFDAGTSTWTLTTDRRLAAGELVDLAGTGVFTLEHLGVASPVATRRRFGQIGAFIHVY